MKDTYTVDVELNIEDSLKNLKKLKEEVKNTIKEIDFSIKNLRLKRRDILVVKLNGIYKQTDIANIKKS